MSALAQVRHFVHSSNIYINIFKRNTQSHSEYTFYNLNRVLLFCLVVGPLIGGLSLITFCIHYRTFPIIIKINILTIGRKLWTVNNIIAVSTSSNNSIAIHNQHEHDDQKN